MSFRYLEHPSDIGIEVVADRLELAFKECYEALISLIFGSDLKLKIKSETAKNNEIKSIDIEALLIDFLNEILFIIDAEKIIPVIKDIIIEKEKLLFSYYEAEFQPIILYVKAITFHQLCIEKKENYFRIVYFVDL